MAEKVFLHIGLPKTGTTYLQTMMWGDRERMRDQGVLLPGRERRDHLWASRVIRHDPNVATFDERRLTSWARLTAEIAAWEANAVISHEFFAGASTQEAAVMVADLAPAEVHVVVTARDALGLFTSSWQESLKNRDTVTMAEYAAKPVSQSSQAIWNWHTLDIRLVLERWAPVVTPANVHVLPLPGPGAPRNLIWERFATLLGLDPHEFDDESSFPNESMGVVEAETLRRINLHLQDDDFTKAVDRGVYIRTFLADERLVPRNGERYWPAPGVIEECRRRADDAIEHIRAGGYDVIGDLEDLRVPADLPERRTAESVTDAEVAEVAVAVAGQLMHDVRRLRMERNAARRRVAALEERPAPGFRHAIAERFPWARRFVIR
ncbi:MAG: hypothetical protein JWR52_1543 [Marmoricola sp.]|nr:hypothetical protein [Marmoricola sp.]